MQVNPHNLHCNLPQVTRNTETKHVPKGGPYDPIPNPQSSYSMSPPTQHMGYTLDWKSKATHCFVLQSWRSRRTVDYIVYREFPWLQNKFHKTRKFGSTELGPELRVSLGYELSWVRIECIQSGCLVDGAEREWVFLFFLFSLWDVCLILSLGGCCQGGLSPFLSKFIVVGWVGVVIGRLVVIKVVFWTQEENSVLGDTA